MITDALAHPPPTGGKYSYSDFTPASATFPKRGQSFTDPVFGSSITRLTTEYPKASGSDIYAKNGFWNATGTLMAHNTPAGLTIINTMTGHVVRSNVPGNFDGSFAPDDPDAWYYFDGPKLCAYSVTSGHTVAVKTFTAKLGKLGGSLDWIDRTGRYMVLNIGGTGRVWDRQADALYAGAIPGNPGDGWLAISPDARYVVAALGDKRSYAINHDARTVNTAGVMFWSLCGDHGDLVSVSDGRTFFITHDCSDFPGVWRVDITKAQTAGNAAKQRAENKLLLNTAWADNDGHISAAGDWAYVSTEATDDPHGHGVTNWRPYEQEILRVHVLTGEIQRLAHHRSRGISGSYYYQPRVCASWDGTRVAWASNFGYNGPDYGDIYAINLGAPIPVVPPVVPPPVGDVTHTVEVFLDGTSVYRKTM